MLTLRPRHRSPSIRALTQWCALTLVVLAATPFTSPFLTFDPGLSARGNALHRNAPAGVPERGPSIADTAFCLATVGDDTEYLKNLALAPTVLPPFAPSPHTPRAALRNAASGHLLFGLLSSAILRI